MTEALCLDFRLENDFHGFSLICGDNVVRGRFGRPRTSQVKQLPIQTTSKLCLNLHFMPSVENSLLMKEIFME